VRGHLVTSLINEGAALTRAGEPGAGLGAFREAVELAARQLAADPRNRWNQIALFMAERALGQAQLAAGDAESARLTLQGAAERAEQVVAEDPANAFSRNELGVIYNNLVQALEASGAEVPARCALAARRLALWEALASEGRLSGEYAEEPGHARAAHGGCEISPPSP
jgi:tetratricopeptide (TPR) repeat protein